MNGRTLNKLLNIGAQHALYREDGGWYHHLEAFPGALFDRSGYVVFHNQYDYLSHPDLNHGQDLHITLGISSMKEYILFTDEQKRKIIFETKEVDEESIRVLRQINVIVRNVELMRKVKKIYKDTCQLCTTRLSVGNVAFYSEVHHIKPLGKPHNGPDKLENMICVCPNCHVCLDLGAIPIDNKSLKLLKHTIENEYITYHNSKIYTNN